MLINAVTRSSPILPRWLLGTALKWPCSTGAPGWSVPAAAARRFDMVVTGTKRGRATASTRTPSPEPEPKRQMLTAPSASNRALPGLQMPRMSSTIPAPAITISEAAPARPKSRRPSLPRDVAFRAN